LSWRRCYYSLLARYIGGKITTVTARQSIVATVDHSAITAQRARVATGSAVAAYAHTAA
jgi:hypothetical protein